MTLPGRRPNRRAVIIASVVFVIIAMFSSVRFYTDILWFQEVGFASRLFKSLSTQFFVGLAGGLLMAALVWLNLWIAGRVAPAYRAVRLEPPRPDPFDRYRDALTPYVKWLRLAAAAAIGIMGGLAASSSWQVYLLWANRVPFGIEDPQFHRDAGFYVFELPFLTDILGWLWFALFVTIIVSAVAHYFFGAIRPEFGWAGVTPGALAHLSVLLGALALVKAGQYWLGQYELNFSPRGVVFTGASYTDVHAHLPALRVLAIVSVISAILFMVNIRVRRLVLPLAAVGIWILFAVVAGGLWPLAVQRFSVEPQELARERPFIERNIEATRYAFGIDEVVSEDFAATSDLTSDEISGNQAALDNVRVWDPDILVRAYAQLQTIRTFYRFTDVDVDRYEVDGRARQVLLSARELALDGLGSESQNWANVHLRYTHGYGIAASPASESTTAGQPEFLVKDIPESTATGAEGLELEQPRIYFGENFESDDYSIVNSKQVELDFSTEDGTQDFTYDGTGGVPVKGFIRRLAFAVRETDPNLLLSSQVTNESRILLYKDVRDRIHRAAPFLSLDNDPYPAIVDGHIVWIVDAYTTSPWYPYSRRVEASSAVTIGDGGALSGTFNYIRNSVKVVVDAYDGTMDFYIVDPDDPLIRAWAGAFPDLFTEEEPSEELREHFRYPEDLFRVQSEMYLKYHVDSADLFFAGNDEWDIPSGAKASTTELGTSNEVAPTYLLITLPGETDDEFLLTRPFTPHDRPNMIAFMVARADPERYGELLTLEFPSSRTISGPAQIDNVINQDVEISSAISLLSQQGSEVEFGSLVILPIEDSILYVQPLFVTANAENQDTTAVQSDSGIPELKRVIVVLGEEVVVGDDFAGALSELFGIAPTEPEPPAPPGEGEPPGGGPDQPAPRLEEIVTEAGRVYEEAQQALQDGDFERYGQLIERLGNLLEKADRLSQ